MDNISSQKNKKFVHLHLHTQYSLLEGAIHTNKLVKYLKKYNMPACAITDHGNMHGAIEFYKTLKKEQIKPLIGQGFVIKSWQKNDPLFYKINLICLNNFGYKNLIKLSSFAIQENQFPHLTFQQLKKYNDGLIIILPSVESQLYQFIKKNQSQQVSSYIDWFDSTFYDRFYLEIQPPVKSNIDDGNTQLYDFSVKNNINSFISSNCFYLDKNIAYSQHILKLIGRQERIDPNFNKNVLQNNNYLKTYDELKLEIEGWSNNLLENTVIISDRCELNLDTKKVYLPEFIPPKNITLIDHFKETSKIGLKKKIHQLKRIYKWENDQLVSKSKIYYERLEYEIEVIIKMGYYGYYLIVADIVKYAKDHKIMVGPGRGSGAGSLVAYCLSITDIDPVKYDLLFERFLNLDRVSMPDFDIDIEVKGRERVIDYIKVKFGNDNVAHISAIGTLQARAVLRSVGRVLNIPYLQIDNIAKLIPKEIGITLSQAIEKSDDLQSIVNGDDINLRELFKISLNLEGLKSNLSTHAAGLVIMDCPIYERLPICLSSDEKYKQTQYPMEDIESQGAVKFDLLGLKNLSIIDNCLKLISKNKSKKVPKINELQLDDPNPYKLINKGLTSGIFQLESDGIKSFVKKYKPNSFEELIALLAIYRPGPLQSGMTNDFISRKNGIKPIEYLHDNLEDILKKTWGVIIYQEQVMKIAQIMANFSLNEADLLRRAMGKKKAGEFKKLKKKFIEGCLNNRINSKVSIEIFDLIEKFAGYGFNRSHAAAYGIISFQTAYLKYYYTAEFMSTLMTMHYTNQEYIGKLIRECKILNINIIAPDVNKSEEYFLPIDDNNILFGLRVLKNLGLNAAKSIVKTRRGVKKYNSINEFFLLQDLAQINSRGFESLISCGALNSLHNNRQQLNNSLDHIMDQLHSIKKSQDKNQPSIFKKHNIEVKHKIELLKDKVQFDPILNYQNEKLITGWSFSPGPIEFYSCEISYFKKYSTKLDKIKDILSDSTNDNNSNDERLVYIVGNIVNINQRKTKTNKYYAILTIEDDIYDIDVWLFDEEYFKYRLLIKLNMVVFLTCQISTYRQPNILLVKNLKDLKQVRINECKELVLSLDIDNFKQIIPKINSLLKLNPGQTSIIININSEIDSVVYYEIGEIDSVEYYEIELPDKIKLNETTSVEFNKILHYSNIEYKYFNISPIN